MPTRQKNRQLVDELAHETPAARRSIGERDMNFRNLAIGAALGIAVLGSAAAHADVILSYTGNDFTDVVSPYTTSDKVTATITLASALLPSQPETQVFPVSFSLNDGVQTITNLTSDVSSEFYFATDSSGSVNAWNIITEFGPIPSPFISSENDSNGVQDEGAEVLPTSGTNMNDPGTWKVTNAAPAPPLSNLATMGVLGVVFLGDVAGRSSTSYSNPSIPDRHQRLQRIM